MRIDDLTIYIEVFVAMEVPKTVLIDSAIVSTNNIVKLKRMWHSLSLTLPCVAKRL